MLTDLMIVRNLVDSVIAGAGTTEDLVTVLETLDALIAADSCDVEEVELSDGNA